MVITRVLLAAFLLFVMVGCGKLKKESKQPAAQPQPAAQQNQTADALFDEFFDDTPKPQPEQPVQTFDTAPTQTNDSPVQREISFSPNGRYVVQVSTIASPSLAEEVSKKLQKLDFPAYVVSVENPTTELIGTYYRVRIGGFDGIADAKYFGENMLRPLGYDYWVDNKSNDNIGIGGAGLGDFYPQAVDYDTQPVSTPAPEPAAQPAPAPAPVAEEPAPAEVPAAADTAKTQQPATAAADTTPAPAADDNNWDNFEW